MHSPDDRRHVGPDQLSCTTEIESVEQALTRLIRLAESRRTTSSPPAPGIQLDRPAYTLLSRLDECATTRLTELAALVEIDLSTASRQVRGLEDRGFVARVEDPCDQRAAQLELTEAGRQALAGAHAARVERIASRLADWEDGEIEDLARLLTKLVSSFTDAARPAPVVAAVLHPALDGARR